MTPSSRPSGQCRTVRNLLPPVIAAAFLALTTTATALADGPLHHRPQNPMYLLSLGPNSRGPSVLPPRKVAAWTDFSYSNIIEYDTGEDRFLLVDMELMRVSLNLACGIGKNTDLALEIPLQATHRGWFDGIIGNFHHAFGLPLGPRPLVPDNAFAYRIISRGRRLAAFTEGSSGPGDIILTARHSLIHNMPSFADLSCVARLKLPTGNSAASLGSGGTDWSLGFAAKKQSGNWCFYSNIDYISPAAGELLGDYRRDHVFAWLVAAEYGLSDRVSVIAQIQGSTPLMEGYGNSRFDGTPLDLVLGLTGRHRQPSGTEIFWQWSFSEDLDTTGPSVDISTMFTVGVRM